ncbi:MAG: bifunctional molybdenum cofactor biosynthesis protein MoaC/MoaB [Chitinophagaceae bacterium]
MVDILNKISSLRIATACATVSVSKKETILAIKNNEVPKGNVFEFARASGLLAIKKTADLIPDCHPLPIEKASISYELLDSEIVIYVEVATIYKTGVEVEAMHGASIVALTIYDMLKPIDKGVEIKNIKLLNKQGGKTSFITTPNRDLQIAVIVCSDSVSQQKKEDKAGKSIIAQLQRWQLHAKHYTILPDDIEPIQQEIKKLVAQKVNLIILTGGTGLSKRDSTPQAIQPLLDVEIPGIMEHARNFGQARTPYAMLSRGVAGMIGDTLIITLPGSTKGAEESMQALFPYLLHIFDVTNGYQHISK